MVDVLKTATVILVASTLVACASSSNQQSAADQVAPVVAANGAAEGSAETPVLYGNEDRMVCKKFAPTGTRISQRVCKKQSEWDAYSKNATEGGADAQRRATLSNATR